MKSLQLFKIKSITVKAQENQIFFPDGWLTRNLSWGVHPDDPLSLYREIYFSSKLQLIVIASSDISDAKIKRSEGVTLVFPSSLQAVSLFPEDSLDFMDEIKKETEEDNPFAVRKKDTITTMKEMEEAQDRRVAESLRIDEARKTSKDIVGTALLGLEADLASKEAKIMERRASTFIENTETGEIAKIVVTEKHPSPTEVAKKASPEKNEQKAQAKVERDPRVKAERERKIRFEKERRKVLIERQKAARSRAAKKAASGALSK